MASPQAFGQSLPPQLQDRNVQIGAGVLLVLVILGVVLFFVFAGGGGDEGEQLGLPKTLASDIPQGRAIEIVAKLKSSGLQAEMIPSETGGVTIEVPEKHYDAAILELAGSTLLSNEDFSLFDSTDFAATDFEKRVKYMRAVGGEMSRVIGRLDGVRTAKAHVTIPEKRLFATKARKPETSASITLELEPGHVLTRSQVETIISVVYGYVPEVDKVSVTDGQGRVYASASGPQEGISGGGSPEIRERINGVEQRVQGYLDHVLGPDRSKVVVSSRFERARRSEKITEFYPGAIGTEEHTEESLAAPDAKDRQDTYTGAFPPPPPPDDSSPQAKTYECAHGSGSSYLCGMDYKHRRSFVEEHPSYRQITIERPPGELQNMKISVVLAADAMPENMTSFKRAIAAAADPSMSPRDVEVVTGKGFEPPEKESEKPEPKGDFGFDMETLKTMPWWVWASGGGVLLLFLLLGASRGGGSKKQSRPAVNNRQFFNAPAGEEPKPSFESYQPQPQQPQQPSQSEPEPEDEIPFELDEDFSFGEGEEEEQPQQPQAGAEQQQPQQQQQRRRPQVNFEE